MRYPDFLQEGDVIEFAAPSFGCVIEPYHSAFMNALTVFEKRGYKTLTGPNCFKSDGCGISSTPENCASEIMEAFLSKGKVIFSCGGGELMCEILDKVDYCAIKNASPKWFMGYSDNTNITFLLNTLADTASIYGPCAPSFGMKPWHASLCDAFDLVAGKKVSFKGYGGWERESKKDETHPFEPFNITEDSRYVLYDGNRQVDSISVKGRLLGGCIDCLNNLAGTRFDAVKDFNEKYGKDGILWFLEACDLNVFEIRRSLWHLKMCGWFESASGFLVGRPGCFGQDMFGLDQYEAVVSILGDMGLPIIMDLDIGHLPPQVPIMSGSLGSVTASKYTWEIEYRME